MKNRYKIFLALVASVFLNNSVFAQDIYDKLTRKLCKCIEREKVVNADGIGPCFEDLLANNLEEIKEYHNAETISDIDMEEMGNKVGAKMIKECDYVLENFPSGFISEEKKVSKQIDLNCIDLKSGDYYYLTKRPNSAIQDTTFVTISNDMFLERMKNGKTFSLLKIIWKDECKFDLEFKESNDPLKKEMSKPGELYQYEVLTNGVNSYFIKVFWRKRDHQFELFKL